MNEVVGVVDFFDRFTGRGQILGGDRRIYWTHRKELVGARVLQTGQRVVFTATEAPRGPRARAVRPLEPAPLLA